MPGIFAVAAYNGGSRNVAKFYRVLTRMKLNLDELRRPRMQVAGVRWHAYVFGAAGHSAFVQPPVHIACVSSIFSRTCWSR
jgi:hypothetical protein